MPKKCPFCRSSGEGERDDVGSHQRIGFHRVSSQISYCISISSVDCISIGEVFVYSHGLISCSDNGRKLDRVRRGRGVSVFKAADGLSLGTIVGIL